MEPSPINFMLILQRNSHPDLLDYERRINLFLSKSCLDIGGHYKCPGMRRIHIHVRQQGSWSEQFNLLFRDYLREHDIDRMEYTKVKYELANLYRYQREEYVKGKTEIIWNIMMKANVWSQIVGWKPSNPICK
jgi:hypothetical protein